MSDALLSIEVTSLKLTLALATFVIDTAGAPVDATLLLPVTFTLAAVLARIWPCLISASCASWISSCARGAEGASSASSPKTSGHHAARLRCEVARFSPCTNTA